MVGLSTARGKFDCCVMLGIISKEAHFSIVNCPVKCKSFSCVNILNSSAKLWY